MSGSTLVIGAGTNLGGRWSILRAARDLVAHRFGDAALRVAPVWETAPLGPPQPDYLNTAFALDFDGDLTDALARCLAVERSLGRERRERWGPRTLDLDLLWHASRHLVTDGLAVPHAGLRARAFALDPLLALVPDAVDPTDGAALAQVRALLPPSAAPSRLDEAFETHATVHTADEGFVVRAPDRADLLAAAAEAVGALMVVPRSVAPEVAVTLDLPWGDDTADDERLFTTLAEVLHHLDTRRFALRRAAVLDDSAARTRLVLLGEAWDESRHEIRGALKAITWHELAVGPRPEGPWEAHVIIDV